MEKRFSIDQMKSALLAIEGHITPKQMAMLKGHYARRTSSFQKLAVCAGYQDPSSAKLQYGWIGRRIAWQLGFRTDQRKMHTISSVVAERDESGHRQWRLDDVVASALEEIGWVSVEDR